LIRRVPERVATRSPARDSADAFGLLRVALIAQIPALLDTLGCDSRRLLRQSGITTRQLADPENRIGYQAVGRLLHQGVKSTGLPHFGVLVGERFDPSAALGDVIQLMRNAPTLAAALQEFVLHHYLNDSGATPMLLPHGGRRVVLAHAIHWPEVPALDTFYDAAVAYGIQIMRLLCGPRWMPLRVTLARRPPDDASAYLRMFGPHIRFNANVSSIEFDCALLARPVVGADASRYAALRQELRARLDSDAGPLSEQVRKALRPMVVGGTASASGLATLFEISDRVLRSRLAREGTTVRRLILRTRLEMAVQLLRTTRLSVSEISAAVGYADPPSFVRSFRRQFDGVTPGQWRV
jgi:AraC-like DNA-binding protein